MLANNMCSGILMKFLFFVAIIVASVFTNYFPPNPNISACLVLANQSYYDFHQFDQETVAIYTDQNLPPITWSFFVQFCGRVDAIVGPWDMTPYDEWLGWNFGLLSKFSAVFGGGVYGENFYQFYEMGDIGFDCVASPRTAHVYIFCGGCPTGSVCLNGTSDFCICGVSYNSEAIGIDGCTARLNLSIECPSAVPIVYPPPTPPEPPGSVAGIVILVLFLLGVVGCFGGCVYNYKINNRRGINAIPGVIFIRQKTHMDRYSGSIYNKTSVEIDNSTGGTYGTL